METVKIAKFGTREDVYNGLAQQTKGKLKKEDLILCEKTGKYKSIKAIERGRSLIQNVRKPVVSEAVDVSNKVEELPPTPAPTPEPVEEKPKRQRKKKVPEVAA